MPVLPQQILKIFCVSKLSASKVNLPPPLHLLPSVKQDPKAVLTVQIPKILKLFVFLISRITSSYALFSLNTHFRMNLKIHKVIAKVYVYFYSLSLLVIIFTIFRVFSLFCCLLCLCMLELMFGRDFTAFHISVIYQDNERNFLLKVSLMRHSNFYGTKQFFVIDLTRSVGSAESIK